MDDKKNKQFNLIKMRLEDAQKKQATGDLLSAIQCYQEIITEHPHDADALHYLGLAYYQNKEYELVAPLLEKAIELNPNAIHFRKNNAIAYKNMKLINLAVRDLQYFLNKQPNDIQSKESLAELYQQQAENYRAISLVGIKDFVKGATCKQALQIYHEFLKTKLDAASLCFELGFYYYSQGDSVTATSYYRRAIEYKPNYPSAHWNMALSLLSQGDFKAGWLEYEWRFFSNAYLDVRDNMLLQDDRYPRWQGQQLKNKTLLVIAEQGRGDAIQFIRFLPRIKQDNCRIILQTREELIPLFKSISVIDDFCINRDDVPGYDYYLPMMSLPFILKIREKDLMAAKKPYLSPTVALTIPDTTRKLKVGISYKGSKHHAKDATRSMSWQQFAPILNNKDIQFYNLQKENDEMVGFSADNLLDLTNKMSDFDHTAAMIMQMDLIICVDTAIAHLAGALGKPVWILLATLPDWRWMRDRDDSPWYPSARLYRQRKNGDWGSVISNVQADLAQLVNKM
jgi:tetratricopeptide (TPR) repeat protein